MAASARRDNLLAQIRELPIEDREYIEAALMREAFDAGRRTASADELAEIRQRAADALSGRNPSYSREESVRRARAAVEVVRPRKVVKDFRIETVAQTEVEEAAAWYEEQCAGLGFEFIAEIDRVLMRIAHATRFAMAPIATVAGGVVRRELVERFPYVVVFLDSDPARWRSRL